MTFKYKITRPKRQERILTKPLQIKDAESLTGKLDGQDASDLEERFGRALRKYKSLVTDFQFQVSILDKKGMPGYKTNDFWVYTMWGNHAVEIDGAFAHKSISTKQEDLMKDQIIGDYLISNGLDKKVIRIPSDEYHYDLMTQDNADLAVREIFG